MQDFEDDDVSYANAVQLFADVLDSPILTTTRDQILKNVTAAKAAAEFAKSLPKRTAQWTPGEWLGEIKRYFKKDPNEKRLSRMARDACSLVANYLHSEPVQLLPIELRFEVLKRLKGEPGPAQPLSDHLTNATNVYDKMSGALIDQLIGLSPLAVSSVRKLDKEGEQYAAGSAVCEQIVHSRQAGGLLNTSGSAKYQSPRLSKVGCPGISLVCSGDIILVKINGVYYVTSWEDFLCWRSILLFRRNCLLLIAIDESIPLSLIDSLKLMWKWQELCIIKLGNQGYELAKGTEATFKARMIRIADGQIDRDAYDLMIDKQKEKERVISKSRETPLVDSLDGIATSVTDIREAAELFGAVKFSGFPYIDPRVASGSSKAYGQKKGHANFAEVVLMRNQFCDMILRGYLKKHARWPDMVFSVNSNTSLERLYRAKPLTLGASAYPLIDWNYCRFCKMLEFDYHLDYLDMMDDKSLGLDSQDAWKAWTSLKNEAPNLSRIPDDRSKKLIIRLLAMPKFDPVEVCRIMRSVDLSALDLCMALYPKEKEFKLEARLFVMLQFQVRYFLTLAETNFKHLMKAYLEDQSMTKGRKGTMQYLEKMSQVRRDDEVDTVFIEIDLTRWNLLWQGDVVDHVSRVADDIFGTPGMFSRGHDIFSNSTIVVRIADDPPPGIKPGSRPREWPESHYVWRKHLGGFEGIIQGQWTACTQAELKLALKDAPIESYTLLGQGDNQVLAVTYKRDHSMSPAEQARHVSDKITEILELRFSLLNQIVKPEECLTSRNLVTYSKLIWAAGVQIPTTLKHAATVAPVGTSYIPSLVTGLEAISSGCRAAADSFADPSRAYLYFLTLYRDYLTRAVKTLPGKDGFKGTVLKTALVDLLSILPADLGGLPNQGPSDFLYGGVSDHLSSSVAHLVVGSHKWPELKHYLGYLETDLPWKKEPDPSLLLQDPFAVPVLRSVETSARIKIAMKEVLPSITGNRDIKPIVSSAVDQYDKRLSTYLTALRPFYPLLMTDLRELSVIGVKKKLETKFVGTRTIQQTIRGRAPINYRSSVLLGDANRFGAALNHLKVSQQRKLESRFPSRSVFLRVECYRARWFPSEPSPIRGVSTLHPLEAVSDDGMKRTSTNYLEFIVHAPGADALATRGPHQGRWGDKTWEHRKSKGVVVLGNDRSTLASKRLLLMESQLAASGSFKETIRQVLRQRTTVDEDLLAVAMPTVIGGVAAHRWDSTTEDKAFAWLGPIMITQHTSVQTDSMTSLSGGQRDYSFCFQEHIFFGLQMARALAAQRPQAKIAFRLHYDISDDHEIVSVPIQAPPAAPIPPNTIETLRSNPLISTNTLLIQSLSYKAPTEIAPTIPLHSIHTSRQRIACMTHYFLDQLENPIITEVAVAGGFPSAGISLDVGAIVGMGMQDLVKAAGAAVALRAAEITLSKPLARIRPSALVGMERLAEVAAIPLARFANAPGVRDQEWVRRSGVLISPGRAGFKTIVQSLTAKIRQAALQSVGQLPEIFSFRMILSQYAERATPSRVLGCLVAMLILITSLWDESVAQAVFRKHLLFIQQSISEEQRVAGNLALIELMSSADLPVSSFSLTILSGRFLSQVPDGFDETCRYMRRFVEPLSAAKLPVVKVKQSRSVVPASMGAFSGEAKSYHRLSRLDEDSAYRLVERNLKCAWSSSTISRDALPVLSTIKSVINGGMCCLVGVGRGAIARDLLALGAAKVVGLDLATDIPNVPSLGTAYLPPELPSGLRQGAWEWSSAAFVQSGDWYDQSATGSLLESGFDLVVIDIQHDQRDSTKKLDPLIRSGYTGWYCFRELLTDSERDESMALLRAVSEQVSIYAAPSHCEIEEYWVVGKLAGDGDWSRCQREDTRKYVVTVNRLVESPSQYWYPDVTEQLLDYVLHGRAEYWSLSLAMTIEKLLLHLPVDDSGSSLARCSEFEYDQVFLAVAALHTERVSRTLEESALDRYARIAEEEPPAIVLGRKGRIDAREWRRLWTRYMPRISSVFEGR